MWNIFSKKKKKDDDKMKQSGFGIPLTSANVPMPKIKPPKPDAPQNRIVKED